MDLGWTGVAAVGAVLVGLWGHIRWAFGYCSSYLIVTFECHGACGMAVMAFCQHSLKASPFRARVFDGGVEYIRPKQSHGFVARETVGVSGGLYWYGWVPMWIARTTSVSANDDHTTNHKKPLKISTVRPFFSVDKFILDALEFAEARVTKRPRRHRMIYHCGAGKRMMTESQPALNRSPGNDHWESLESIQDRILRWEQEDLGPHISNGGSGALALSDKVMEFCVEVRRWAGMKAWCLDRSIPWKLGALFYGPPGTGKTALARALGQELDMPIHIFDLASMSNRELRDAWQSVTSDLPAIALLEDIDGAFVGREAVNGAELTFDCLLNCIDGVERTDGLMTIVTTNKPDTLDDALRNRPGRIDVQLEFANPDEAGRRHMAQRILGDWPDAIEEVVAAGEGDSGAQFERRCIAFASGRILNVPPGEPPGYECLPDAPRHYNISGTIYKLIGHGLIEQAH